MSFKWTTIIYIWEEKRIHLQQHLVCDQATENELVPPHPETKTITSTMEIQKDIKSKVKKNTKLILKQSIP